jgi:hypothetical protein
MNPFDLKSAILAEYAQVVGMVLVFITSLPMLVLGPRTGQN